VVFSESSANETDRHDITEILLKVALNTIKQTSNIRSRARPQTVAKQIENIKH
jgi:hypothetical protein